MLGFVLALHQLMVWLILLAAAAALVLGVAWLIMRRNAAIPLPGASVAEPPPSPTANRVREYLRYALVVTAGLGVLQAIFGGLLYVMGQRPPDALHYVYGLIVLLAIPVAYAYSDQAQVRRDVIIMMIAVVAVIGAAIRAWMTGGGIGH